MSCKKLLFRLNPGFFRYICVNLEIPMPERDEIHQQLRKITESEIFSRSGINVNLLLLLVKATLDKEKLKEAAIGTELFGKSYDPVKNDTKVRVYVHNLRKKLAAYYETEGKKDPIIFEIEKGQYWITFAERVRVKNHRKRNWHNSTAYYRTFGVFANNANNEFFLETVFKLEISDHCFNWRPLYH